MATQVVSQRIRELVNELHRLLNPEPDPLPDVLVLEPNLEEEELIGIIGRPECKNVRRSRRWTAGLGIANGRSTHWVNLEAKDEIADMASIIVRGERVRVRAKQRIETFVNNDGIMQHRATYLVSHITSEAVAGSAASPFVAAQKLTVTT